MQGAGRWLLGALLAVVMMARPAAAEPRPAPLTTLPASELTPLASLLRDRDLVLVERDSHGDLKQLTTVTMVQAPPAAVREVVVHPERYPQFVRNMKRSTVVTEPQGTLWHEYEISYRVYSIEGRHRYVLLPARPGDAAAPVEMYDPDGNGVRHYRWEFLPAGGATMLVLYGYTKVPHDGFTGRYIDRAPTLQVGLAVMPQLTLLLAMKSRAQASGPRPALPAGAPASYAPLLARGTVAFVQWAGSRVREVAIAERARATTAALAQAAGAVTTWSDFVPTMKRSAARAPLPDMAKVELEQTLPWMSWRTQFGYRSDAAAVDLVGLSGDLAGARLRFDVYPREDGGPGAVLALRSSADYRKGSWLLREAYSLEPYLECGFDLAMDLMLVQAIRQRAER